MSVCSSLAECVPCAQGVIGSIPTESEILKFHLNGHVCLTDMQGGTKVLTLVKWVWPKC